jgi:hypothetical protein
VGKQAAIMKEAVEPEGIVRLHDLSLLACFTAHLIIQFSPIKQNDLHLLNSY